MTKRIISLTLVISLLFGCISVTAYGASEESVSAANALYSLGLFKGTGTDSDGNPVYELDRSPTRNEAVTMLVRLLGQEENALAGSWETPFQDITEWAEPYVGYAYENGLTNGTSSTTYSGDLSVTASQYLTFVLRALGYVSGVDFEWDSAWTLSDELGITNGEYDENTTTFTRGDVVEISYSVLKCCLKGTDTTLIQKLYEDGLVSYSDICIADLADEAGVDSTSAPTNLIAGTNGYYATISWTDPEEEITGYNVYISTQEDGIYSYYFFTTGGLGYTNISADSTVTAETTYYAKLQSVYIYSYEDESGNTITAKILSPLSEAVAFVVPDTDEEPVVNAPISSVSKIADALARAIVDQQNALYMCQAALTANSSYYGKYYAEQAQAYFDEVAGEMLYIYMLCGTYTNLQDLIEPVVVAYSAATYLAEYEITSSNYLSYVIYAITMVTELETEYSEMTEILQEVVNGYL